MYSLHFQKKDTFLHNYIIHQNYYIILFYHFEKLHYLYKCYNNISHDTVLHYWVLLHFLIKLCAHFLFVFWKLLHYWVLYFSLPFLMYLWLFGVVGDLYLNVLCPIWKHIFLYLNSKTKLDSVAVTFLNFTPHSLRWFKLIWVHRRVEAAHLCSWWHSWTVRKSQPVRL